MAGCFFILVRRDVARPNLEELVGKLLRAGMATERCSCLALVAEGVAASGATAIGGRLCVIAGFFGRQYWAPSQSCDNKLHNSLPARQHLMVKLLI